MQSIHASVAILRCFHGSTHLGVGLLGDVDVLGSVGLPSPLVVPHLSHHLQVRLGPILIITCTQTKTERAPTDLTGAYRSEER